MTAEVAILNTGAVALAADSAVTVSAQRGAKVYNTVNKLFSLSGAAPVGVMIWGGADLSGIPWEVLIKEYRRELGAKRFDSLEEYSADLWKFLTNCHFITDDLQRLSVLKAAYGLYENQVLRRILVEVRSHFDANGNVRGTR